jgi:hypothetical protein
MEGVHSSGGSKVQLYIFCCQYQTHFGGYVIEECWVTDHWRNVKWMTETSKKSAHSEG